MSHTRYDNNNLGLESEALHFVSRPASHLGTKLNCPKSKAVSSLYERLSLAITGAISIALLSRSSCFYAFNNNNYNYIVFHKYASNLTTHARIEIQS